MSCDRSCRAASAEVPGFFETHCPDEVCSDGSCILAEQSCDETEHCPDGQCPDSSDEDPVTCVM